MDSVRTRENSDAKNRKSGLSTILAFSCRRGQLIQPASPVPVGASFERMAIERGLNIGYFHGAQGAEEKGRLAGKVEG